MRKTMMLLGLFVLYTSSSVAKERIVEVALDGSAPFKSPIAAMASITNASKHNRYVISVGPGVYFFSGEQLIMKPYVSVVGAGRTSTIIQSATSGLHCGSDNSSVVFIDHDSQDPITISNLSIRNYGDMASGASGVVAKATSETIIENVDIFLRGASDEKCGVVAQSPVTLRNVTIDVDNTSGDAKGISGFHTSFNLDTVVVNAKADSSSTGSAVTLSGTAFIRNSKLIGSNYGFQSFVSEADIEGSLIQGGTFGYLDDGGFQSSDFKTSINNSSISGNSSGSINMNDNSYIEITNTKIKGSVTGDPAGKQCLNVYDENLDLINC